MVSLYPLHNANANIDLVQSAVFASLSLNPPSLSVPLFFPSENFGLGQRPEILFE